jgi:hypothetical protein
LDLADLRDRMREDIVETWLPAIVDDVLLSPDIFASIERVGLNWDTLVRLVLDTRQDVLAPADTELEHAVNTAVQVPAGVASVISGRAALALVSWWKACRDKGVLPFVRRAIDRHVEPDARFELNVTAEDAAGLESTSESSYVVRTASVEAFLSTIERLPTGAIGLAGPRGVGKTSLIEYFAGRMAKYGGRRALKVIMSAPVQYEPRDFVLHLFATVCQAVLRARDVGSDSIGLRPIGEWVTTLRWRRHLRKSIVGDAHRHLDNIHYLRTYTSGWSGKMALPLKAEARWNRSVQRERRPQTYPEIVTALREFLAAFAVSEDTRTAMIIAIDELDKIESVDRAQQFLNEIKGIFGAPGTQFLVSVSEDALASFERRGLPMRDAFDSAFHEIVRVDYLALADTAELLSSRVLRLPEPFKWLVHCMSGGLPRDVVRTARAMVGLTSASDAPPTLDDVCAALVADDLRRKSHAFQLACRSIKDDGPEVTDFVRLLGRLQGDADTLLGLVPMLRRDGELAASSRQAATYVYYSATLLEVFTRDRVDSRAPEDFDMLARAKQSLALHPRLAWLQVDEFRELWGLTMIPVD